MWLEPSSFLKYLFVEYNDDYSTRISIMSEESSTFDELLKPVNDWIENNTYSRKCTSLPDKQWIGLGIKRVLGENNSGRSFLQRLTVSGQEALWTSHYFDALKSERRLDHLLHLNKELLNCDIAWKDCEDPISAECPELDGYVINSGDGHHIKAPVHEEKVGGSVYTTQNFYANNIRNNMMWHMTVAEYGDTRKKEHDMRALKRQNIEVLRAGATKGVKSLWIWDRACMDFPQWHEWKMKGIYFITIEKDNNVFEVLEESEFDKDDSINYGVLKDEKVESGSKKILLRRITYRCPDTNNIYVFITNLSNKIRPGVIAFLYKCRWNIEKTYNTFKHKLGEQRAWAVTSVAKEAQANFICLAHNLALILNRRVDREASEPEHSPNDNARKKKKRRIDALIKKCEKLKRKVPKLLLTAMRLVEIPKKFFIWIRESIRIPCPWSVAIERLQLCCAKKY
jgi:hypothetical protein